MPTAPPSAPARARTLPASFQWARRPSRLLTPLPPTRWLFRRGWARAAFGLAVTLLLVGLVVDRIARTVFERQVQAEVERTRDLIIAGLETWLDGQRAVVTIWSEQPRVRELASQLVALGDAPVRTAVLSHPALAELRAMLEPVCAAWRYRGFAIVDAAGRVRAATQDRLVDQRVPSELTPLLATVLEAGPRVTPPVAVDLPLLDEQDRPVSGQSGLFAAGPIRGSSGQPIAVLVFRILPEHEFARLLAAGSVGPSGEAYAFARDGLLLSPSRFEVELRAAGLVGEHESAALHLELRDPGGDLAAGYEPTVRPKRWPLTRPVAAAIDGLTGADVVGYRGYLGRPKVGAWQWLPERGFGVVAELDLSEAFSVFAVPRAALGALTVLLVVSAIAGIASSRLMLGMRRKLLSDVALGPYRVVRPIANGGMGEVALARHDLLQRPTAVKILRAGVIGEHDLDRFEREVRVTARLRHPNTIAIYDYGRTNRGDLYYAMECLTGVTLETLVDRFGPLPPGRALVVLEHVAASLAEAHEIGFVHRDVKPANVMLCVLGGLYDFVKVLDFGLVRAFGEADTTRPAGTRATVAGTPLYMAPEAFVDPAHVDPRSDVYAVGAVGYYLLTGTPPFASDNPFVLSEQHGSASPALPSERRGEPLDADLERLILACLAKERSARPADGAALLVALRACARVRRWTQAEARDWWTREGRGLDVIEWDAVASDVPAHPAPATTLVLPHRGPSPS